LFLFPPGYVLAWTFNLLRFRDRSAAEQTLLSLALSVSASPLLAVLLGRFISPTASLVVFGLLGILAAILSCAQVSKARGPQRFDMRSGWIAAGTALLWIAVVLFELVDLQLGHRLYLSVVSYDQCVRTAFVQSALRTGVPPLNPFYFAGHGSVLRYFYYWYVLCALPSKLAGVTARASLIASSVWCGLGLAAIVILYIQHFLHERAHLRRKSLIGIGLLLVTGLDIIPTTLSIIPPHSFVNGEMEWWNPQQVTSWLDSLLWVPHHVASLIACLVGFLVLWSAREQAALRSRAAAAVVAAIAFASAAGLSGYVTFTFAFFLVAWSAVLLWERRLGEFAMYVGTAAATLILSLPYVHDLRGPSASGHRLVAFAIREYPAGTAFFIRHGVWHPWILAIDKLMVMAFIYSIEFGFFALVAVLRFNRSRATARPIPRQERAAWVMLGTALFVASFLRSSVILTNDLGIRSALVVQFVLLLWAVPLVHDLWTGHSWRSLGFTRRVMLRRVTGAALVLGVLGTAYQLTMLRFYAVLADSGAITRTESFLPASPGLGERTYALRDGYEQLGRLIRGDAIVQYNPAAEAFVPRLLYSQHQAAAADSDCGTAFGGDPASCRPVVVSLAPVFKAQEGGKNVDIDKLCDQLSINVLVAGERDQVWQDNRSWVWTHHPLVANESLRALPCGNRQWSFLATKR